MLEIKNLSVCIDNKNIIKNLDLEIKKGEKHCIMSPNGKGKSTLLKAIMGFENYKTKYEIFNFKKIENFSNLPLNERALNGLFLANQNPIEISGINNANFLKTITNNKRNHDNLAPLNQISFFKILKENLDKLSLDISFIERGVNEGFSGGEKKRNEILQMLLLNPDFIMLDEIDSGVDVDSIKIISKNILHFLENEEKSMLLITHYEHLNKLIKPDFVHILHDGKIVKSSDYSLAEFVYKNGYSSFGEG